jgi:phosphonate transport system substrate-binding protein
MDAKRTYPHELSLPAMLLLAAMAILAASCGGDQDGGRAGKPAAVHFGIGGMLTPEEGRRYYLDLLEYLGRKTGYEVVEVPAKSYADYNAKLKSGEIDISFVCSGPYVTGHDEFGLELLVQPQAYGKSTYNSYIIVPARSPARTLRDLKGKTFAFTDPQSNTGCLVPTYLLTKDEGIPPERFFSKLVFTGSHDGAIAGVAFNFVDGAAVDSLIWEYANAADPSLTARTRILLVSQPFGIPPVAVRPYADPRVKEAIRKTLLSMHEDEEGKKILAGMVIDRFLPADDRSFDSIREMQAWLDRRSKKP